MPLSYREPYLGCGLHILPPSDMFKLSNLQAYLLSKTKLRMLLVNSSFKCLQNLIFIETNHGRHRKWICFIQGFMYEYATWACPEQSIVYSYTHLQWNGGASHTCPVYSMVVGSLHWVFFWVTRRTASSFSATISASVGSAFSWLTLQKDKSQEHVCLLKKGQEKEQEGGFKPDAWF